MYISLIIIIITTIASIIAFYDRRLFDALKFNAAHIQSGNEQWRFISYALLHADWIHLFINMYVLYGFGPVIENYYRFIFGTKGVFYFILLYVGGAALSVIPAYGRNKENPFYNAVGASGAISSVVFAIIIINPFASLSLIFLPISFPAVLFGMVYLVYSYIMARKGDGPIGHDTHFWGGIFGMVFTIALKPVLFLSFVKQIIQYFN
ncbi:MAG: hypothetical protein PWR20_99 [Bacteroidales bacterium]|jgi:membrane associated rhomboid family serine protease|nr:hypothetical protein [Bacteroidales bacterium]MDN5328674.1 hypothetical protein [Bacteroidales bacterium]